MSFFILHYILFNASQPAVIVLITLFLQTYANASMSEIGALLMALPFVSILIKPLFCALADRQQAHKLYLMSALALMGLGYGSLSIAPFFPDFIAEHGRTVWYFDIVGIIIGFSAFGVVWSLGDALAVNHAQMRGITWGSYRVWGVVSWGGFGILIGQINEVPFLPKYVPAFFVLITSLLVEIILLAVWPNKHFVMGGTLDEASFKQTAGSGENGSIKYVNQGTIGADGQQQQMHEIEDNWSSANRSLTGTLRGSVNPRMIGSVANIFMEDLGGTLRSSLKFGSKSKRMGLDEILDQHRIVAQPARGSFRHKAAESALTATNANSNSNNNDNDNNINLIINNSTSNNNFSSLNNNSPVTPIVGGGEYKDKQLVAIELDNPQQLGLGGADKTKQLRSPEDLQLVLLKLIVWRDTKIWKYLVMFTIFGALLACHMSYIFLHIKILCRQTGDDFSYVTGAMLGAHSVSEVLCFTVVVPYLVPIIGRSGSLLSCALIFGARFGYYGTYLTHTSPYTAIPFELAHGIVYGIVYSLITDIACECVNQVDLYLPELIERGVVDESIDPKQLKLQLRATMQGLFSGAFDGLGNGLGALFGGVCLDAYPFPSGKFWQFCFYVCLVTIVIYALTEWDTFFGKKQQQQGDKSKQAKC